MKQIQFSAALLAASAVQAQGFSMSLSYDQSRTRSVTYTTHVPDNSLTVEYPSKAAAAIGLHVFWTALRVGTFNLELAGTYQFPTTTELPFNYQRSTLTGTSTGSSMASYKSQYFAPGLRLFARQTLDWGFGVEYRLESLRLAGADPNNPSNSISSRQQRPWANVSIGYTFPRTGIQPFLAASWSMALIQPSTSSSLDTDLPKSMGQRYEASLQAGLRF